MPREKDSDRVVQLLYETEGLSNARIKNELGLGDDRYIEIKDLLLSEGLVEKYKCRGGGVRLTRQGEKASPKTNEYESSVKNEKELYSHLMKFVEKQSEDDEIKSMVKEKKDIKIITDDVIYKLIEEIIIFNFY